MQKVSIIRSQAVKSALVGLVATLIPVMVPALALNSYALPDAPITISNITITAPVAGATPVSSTTSNGEYTTAITWNGFPSTFGEGTVYTATVVVTPDPGFTLTGVEPDFFTVNGAATTPQLFASSTFGVTGANPQGVAVDSLGNIYVTNNNDDNVTKITPQGISSIFGTTGDQPYGIAIDSFGNVYTSNLGSDNVTKITPQGNSTTFGTTGDDPYYIAIDSSNNVYTANYGSDNVTKITPQGISSIFGTTGDGPYGIAIDSLGNVYTTNWDAKNLTKITPEGVSSDFGQTGNAPSGLVLDTNGNFYTANFDDNNVSKITPEGVSTIFGTTGANPYDIKIDTNGNIYTPNLSSDNVTVITPQGDSEILSTTGSGPVAIAFDSSGNFYTANYNAGSVTKIANVGAAGFSYEFPATGDLPRSGLNPTFGTPTSTADGFTVSIDNYDPDFTWATPTVSAGSVSNWSTRSNSSGSRVWLSIASDAYGTKLAAVENVGYIYTSTDSGVTWSKQEGSGSRAWRSITSSDDGTKLAAAVSGASGGYIYTSTDSGVTWTEQTSAGSREWRSITSSDDGTSLAAVPLDGYIYTSEDSGATWTERTGSGQTRIYRSITSSNDGGVLAAVVQNGYIYTSTNSGATWTERTSSGRRQWRWIASSGDGAKLAAVSKSDIYTSTDSGATWTRQTGASSDEWRSITSSEDGTKLAAVEESGYIYTSTDSGATWSQQTSAGSREWRSIASSNDGATLAAVVLNDYIYTWSPTFLTVSGLTSGVSATITQATSRVGYTNGSSTVIGSAQELSAALNPTFGTPTPTTDGFTVSIDNYDPDFTWATPTVSVGSVSATYGINWSANSGSSGSQEWRSIASSSDGTKLAAVVGAGGGYIYTSTDSGATWTERTAAGERNWRSIASSSDGTKLAAVATDGGYIYTSTNSGATWTEQTAAGLRNWRSIASSSDGTKLAAVVANNGGIYTSTNSGATWTEQTDAGRRYWRSIASSSDGTKLVAAVADGGAIYTSTNSGATWTEQTDAGLKDWYSIVSSSDGTKLAAVVGNNGGIYTSTNSGATWTERTAAGERNWRSIASSSDGTKLAAAAYEGYIYTSTDSGATWTEQTSAGSRNWWHINSNSDGTKFAAGYFSGYIYTWSPTFLTVTGLTSGVSATITQTTSRVGYTNGSSTVTGTASAGTTISIGSISIAAPVTAGVPVSSVATNGQYSASISWSGAPSTFAGNTAYTATITITPAAGYTLSGIGADFFSVAGATVTHASDSATFTAVFPTTGPKLTQTISFTQPSAMTMVSSDQSVSATSSAGNSYPVAIASTTTAVCTIVNGAIHVVAAGTCSITTTQAGDGAYEAAKRVNWSIAITKLAQTITFTQPLAMSMSSSDQSLSATSNANGSYPVSFTSNTTGVCTIVNGAIHVVAAGTCSITASQAGDGVYLAASSVNRTLVVTSQKQTQTITFTQPAAMSMTTADQALVARSSAGASYSVSFASRTTGVCTIVNGAIHVVAAGVCSITASQAGDGAYEAATSVVKSIAITKLVQTITFTQPAAMTMTTPNQELTAVSSAAGSYPVSFASTTPSVCTIVGISINVVAAGTCSITATQAGDGTYSAATAVVKSIVISKLTQSITFNQPIDMAKTSSDQTLVATSSAGNLYPVSFASTTTGVCTIVSGAIHVVGGGICSITASRAGDGIYLPATDVVKTIKINKLTQSISFNQPAAMSTLDADQNLVATSNATGSYPVSFASTTTAVCTIVNGAIHAVAGGTCSITASQAGDGTYWPATSVVKSIAIKQPQSTLTILNSNASNIAKGTRGITLSTSFGSGSGAVSYSVSGTGCSYNSSTRVLSVAASYQPNSNTSCTVTATKAAHGIYLVSTSAAKTFTFGNNQ